ncbi:MAG: cellulase family glycosylhydrolase [Candidatus Aminicenantes bacterium]|nr:cellulase family glycosylhydrolase [Candidatus Aminicenantes bacterium]
MKKLQLGAGLILMAAIQLAAITISPLPYGINVHLTKNEVLAKVKAAGITWIRVDVNWPQIEGSKGDFNFTELDRVATYAEANGLSVYATIAYTPGWANGNVGFNYPAADINEWKNFVATIVTRYKTKIKYWGIWNEPNLREFFGFGKDIFVQNVLLPAVQTIRTVDPSAFIVGPELAHLTSSGVEWYFWMKYILDNAGGYFDIISHHIYEDLGVYVMYELLEQGDHLIPAVKQIIEESGQGGKPFWITETGWETSKFSEPMQSLRYLDMLQTRARKDYPQKIFFYEIIDDPNSANRPFGILRSNGEAKPAYDTYRDFIAGLIPDPGNSDDTQTNKKCYAEQAITPAADKAQSLKKLRDARDDLRGFSASARNAVQIYYELNEEFSKIALADSRVANLGREILALTLQIVSFDQGLDVSKPLPDKLFRKTADLVGILSREYAETPIGPLALLLDKNVAVIGQTPLRDLLEFYLKDDMSTLKRIP